MLLVLAPVEPELVRRLRSTNVPCEPLHVPEEASDESQGVDEPELLDECGRAVVEAAILTDDRHRVMRDPAK